MLFAVYNKKTMLSIAFILVAVALFLLITESRPLSSVRWACLILLVAAIVLIIWGGFQGIHVR
jgi:hypothetical protein